MRTLPTGGAGARDSTPADRLRTRADFAWEFLRRNPRYRLIARASAVTCGEDEQKAMPWGLISLANPDLSAGEAGVLWRPDCIPGRIVWLAPSRVGGLSAQAVLAGASIRRPTAEGLHLKLPCGLQVCLPSGEGETPVAAMLPVSGCFSAALRAAGDLERALRGDAISDDLTAQQRARLRRVLFAYDAVSGSATYREIARELFGQEAIDRHDWRPSSVRDTVIQLVRTGRSLVAGGYRDFLSGGAATVRDMQSDAPQRTNR